MTVILATPPRHETAAAGRRAAFAAGLRNLAALVKSNAGVPLPNSGTDYFARGATDAEMFAEVDRIARALGAEPYSSPGGHRTVHHDCGGGVLYRAIAVPRSARSESPAEAA